MKTYIETLKKEILPIRNLIVIFSIAFFYITATLFALNYHIVLSTISSNFSLLYKATVLVSLLLGIFTAFATIDTLLLCITSILVGCNILLLLHTAQQIHIRSLKLFVGGGSFFGLLSAGCGACGFSLLSFAGISTSILPFGNNTLYLLSICTLLISFFLLIKKLSTVSCAIV